jgi:hypothetical protein
MRKNIVMSHFLCVVSLAAIALAAAAQDTLQLRAPSHDPVSLKAADFKALPHITVTIHNPHTNADESYSGVRLAELFAKMSAPLGSELHGKALSGYVIATGADNYRAVFALAEIDPSFHPGEILVTDEMKSKPLDAHDGPFKIIATEDKRPARGVRNLVSLELKMSEEGS